MTVNSSHLINPNGRVAIIYSVHLFLYYSVLRHDVLLQKTYPLPASECDYPPLRGARLTWGAGQWPSVHLTERQLGFMRLKLKNTQTFLNVLIFCSLFNTRIYNNYVATQCHQCQQNLLLIFHYSAKTKCYEREHLLKYEPHCVTSFC